MSPTHSNGLASAAQAEQRAEALLVRRVLQRLVAGEHGLQVGAVHERGEDEVDEATLVAAPHQWSRRCVGVLVEGAVAAAKGAVDTASGARTAPPPRARCAAGGRRTPREPARAWRRTRSPKARSNSSPFDHWWFTASPSVTRVGTEADHSLESTTASRRSRTAATSDGRGDDGGDGHVPVEEPELGRAADEGVDGPFDPSSRAARSRRRRPRWRRSGRRVARRRTGRRPDGPPSAPPPSRWSRCRRRRG